MLRLTMKEVKRAAILLARQAREAWRVKAIGQSQLEMMIEKSIAMDC